MSELDEFRAREIASEWHSGQWSSLYAFSSSGTIDDGLMAEVESCLAACSDPAECERLEALLAYVIANSERAEDD